MGKPALLIIDMQNDSCLPGAAFEVRGALGVLPNVKKLLDAFRMHGLPVVHVAREYRADGTDIEITRRDRGFHQDVGRRKMIDVFQMAADQEGLVHEYRSRRIAGPDVCPNALPVV